MATVKCEKCGKEFDSERGLKIHMGLVHSAKPKTPRRPRKASARKKAPRAKAARRGKFVCPDCGRSFKMAAHLARHRAATHGRAKRKKATRRPGRPRTSSGLNVNTFPISQLVALKREVDGRLATIVQQMRRAKIRI